MMAVTKLLMIAVLDNPEPSKKLVSAIMKLQCSTGMEATEAYKEKLKQQ